MLQIEDINWPTRSWKLEVVKLVYYRSDKEQKLHDLIIFNEVKLGLNEMDRI